MPYFPPVTANGITYDLDHLDPLTLQVESTMANKVLKVGVRFSNHCFTGEYLPATHPAGFPVLLDAGKRERSFCHVRYSLSQQLPAVVQGLTHPKVQVWQTAERRNWVYSMTIPNPAGAYHVFFELRRAAAADRALQDLNLVVESAYPEDPARGGPNVLGRMGFVLLCGKVYTGKPLATKR